MGSCFASPKIPNIDAEVEDNKCCDGNVCCDSINDSCPSSCCMIFVVTSPQKGKSSTKDLTKIETC